MYISEKGEGIHDKTGTRFKKQKKMNKTILPAKDTEQSKKKLQFAY